MGGEVFGDEFVKRVVSEIEKEKERGLVKFIEDQRPSRFERTRRGGRRRTSCVEGARVVKSLKCSLDRL